MKGQFYHAIISATSKREAETILGTLLRKRLVSGGLITSGKSMHWWKGKIDVEPYWNISAFTVKKHQNTVITEVRKLHKDETPIISFFKIDYGNRDFLAWIIENTK